LKQIVTELLENPASLETMKNNLKQFYKKHGGEEIRRLVTQMLEKVLATGHKSIKIKN